MSAYFRGAVFDRYHALEAKGEGEMFYIFNTSMDTSLQMFMNQLPELVLVLLKQGSTLNWQMIP